MQYTWKGLKGLQFGNHQIDQLAQHAWPGEMKARCLSYQNLASAHISTD